MGLAALSKTEQNEAVKVQPVNICTSEEKKVRKSGKHVQVNIYKDETSVLRSLCFLGDIDKNAFSYEWTEYLTSLFEPNRDTVLGYVMRKGNKAEYINALKKGLGEKCFEEDTLPTKIDETALFVDAMSFINRHQNFGCNTFHDIQSRYLKKTRIFAYVAYCVHQYGYKCAVVQATDTDIIIMGIYYSVRILGLKELWVQKGAVYIPCHIVARALATQYNTSVLDITSALLCGHFMSGCDTVSYIFGKVKNKAFSVAWKILLR